MTDIAIRCEGLGKQYRIGERERYKALRDTITDAVAAPLRRFHSAFKGTNNTQANGHNEPFWALKDISFEIKRGEVVGIIGHNGAGKSTLLKILSRITAPTVGEVKIHGRVGSLLEVGTGFHPELTGCENIFLNGAILGMRKAEIERKFDDIVSFAEIEKFIDTPVKRYSSGMYVRLAFAVAAYLEPDVLVIDEVLSVGDMQFQKKCLGKMEDVVKHGRTVLFVSHDMTAIKTLCPWSIHLGMGRIVNIGSTTELIYNYLNNSKDKCHIDYTNSIVLGKNLQLCKFNFTPNPVTSGDSIEFKMSLFSPKAVKVRDLAVLIFDSLGKRVAILDLRQTENKYHMNGHEPLTISANITSLPLVEGQYNVGLWVDADDVRKDFFDLSLLTVVSKAKEGTIIPHHASLRGVVELEYSVQSNLDSSVR